MSDIVEVWAPQPIVAEGLAKGYILFGGPCYRCYRGSRPLVNVLAAVGCDTVDVLPAGITINGHRWPGSQRRLFTRDGQRITQWMRYVRTRLDANRVLVLGTHPNTNSWDSRVWSDIPASVRAWYIPISLRGMAFRKTTDEGRPDRDRATTHRGQPREGVPRISARPAVRAGEESRELAKDVDRARRFSASRRPENGIVIPKKVVVERIDPWSSSSDFC